MFEFYQNIDDLKTRNENIIMIFLQKNNKSVLKNKKGPLTIVKKKRVDEIITLLKKHEKLKSTELSEMTGLSRTRCNEYFKLMEKLKIVKPTLNGREKFYELET